MAVLAATGWAGAAAPGPVVAVHDPRDTPSGLDIVRASLQRAADGRLRASVTMRRRWDASDLRNASGPPGSVCVKLWTQRTPGAQPPDYLVCATAQATGDELDGAVTRELRNGLPRRRANATVGRPSARTVVLRFAQSSVGRPATLRFEAGTQHFGTGCPRSRGCVDDAPDAPATASLQLRGVGARLSLSEVDNPRVGTP